MHVDLDTLLNANPTIFQINPQDRETLANISVADLKEMAAAINAVNDRIQGLYKDLQQAEARIDRLERGLRAIADSICSSNNRGSSSVL